MQFLKGGKQPSFKPEGLKLLFKKKCLLCGFRYNYYLLTKICSKKLGNIFILLITCILKLIS